MANRRREQVKRILLVAFVVTCAGLAVFNWVEAIGEHDARPATTLGEPAAE